MEFCSKCCTQLLNGAAFCGSCGDAVSSTQRLNENDVIGFMFRFFWEIILLIIVGYFSLNALIWGLFWLIKSSM